MTIFQNELSRAYILRDAAEAAMSRRVVKLHKQGLTVDQIAAVCRASAIGAGKHAEWSNAAVVLWFAALAKRVNRADKSALVKACHA
ncbi:MAG: hypothetical protein ACK4Z7_09640 [Novosphingobium sp.]